MGAIVAVPPRRRAHPVLGSALELCRSQIETYARVMREHGDVVRLAIGAAGLRLDLYCVFHPDGVREVLAGSRDGFTKRNRLYVQIAEALGWGLLTTEGGRWHDQRRLIQPLFTRKQIAGYAELIAEEVAAIARRWERATRNGEDVDANREMVRLTLRVGRTLDLRRGRRAGRPGTGLGLPGAQSPHVSHGQDGANQRVTAAVLRATTQGLPRGTGSNRGWNNDRVFASSANDNPTSISDKGA